MFPLDESILHIWEVLLTHSRKDLEWFLSGKGSFGKSSGSESNSRLSSRRARGSLHCFRQATMVHVLTLLISYVVWVLIMAHVDSPITLELKPRSVNLPLFLTHCSPHPPSSLHTTQKMGLCSPQNFLPPPSAGRVFPPLPWHSHFHLSSPSPLEPEVAPTPVEKGQKELTASLPPPTSAPCWADGQMSSSWQSWKG